MGLRSTTTRQGRPEIPIHLQYLVYSYPVPHIRVDKPIVLIQDWEEVPGQAGPYSDLVEWGRNAGPDEPMRLTNVYRESVPITYVSGWEQEVQRPRFQPKSS